MFWSVYLSFSYYIKMSRFIEYTESRLSYSSTFTTEKYIYYKSNFLLFYGYFN